MKFCYSTFPLLCSCKILIVGGSIFLFTLGLNAQKDTILLQRLETIEVKAPKIEKPWLKSAISNYNISIPQKGQLAQNSLQEYLVSSPSIFALNGNNRAQDLRIAIRGFGSRAAFGVRGVKIIVDGIPETTTDGQGQLDNLNLGIIERIEVLNNGSAALYGNASGGVLNILTTDEEAFKDNDQFIHLGLGFQSFKGQQHQIMAGKQFGNTQVILHGNYHKGDGYREHAAFESSNFNVRIKHKLNAKHALEAIVNYMNSPEADDPGGVNLATYDSIPTAARDRNVQFNAGEEIQQFKSSLRYIGTLGDHLSLISYAFFSNRSFVGRIPVPNSGMIQFDRTFVGHGTSLDGAYQLGRTDWKWHLGYELSSQEDDRQRFDNMDGIQGDLVLDQAEQFSNVGLFWANDFTLNNWIFNVALRYDFNQIEVEDRFLSNGDDSGTIDLNDFNYSIGLAYQVTPSKSIFANLSTSFETPTLNELSNNPDGSGFNTALKPQFATHYELGFKGFIQNSTTFQLSAFWVNSTDELLPFEIADFPGRTFFRNIGETQRQGIEVYLKHSFHARFYATTNWSFNQFTFENYTIDGDDFSGNKLPGLPGFQGNIQLHFSLFDKLEFDLQNQFLGEIFTNDANTESQSTKSITNVSVQYTWELGKLSLVPYFGVNNVFQAQYADNIRINAFGGRFYEAAPDLFLFGGLRIKL